MINTKILNDSPVSSVATIVLKIANEMLIENPEDEFSTPLFVTIVSVVDMINEQATDSVRYDVTWELHSGRVFLEKTDNSGDVTRELIHNVKREQEKDRIINVED